MTTKPNNWPFPARLPPGLHERVKRQRKPAYPPGKPAPF